MARPGKSKMAPVGGTWWAALLLLLLSLQLVFGDEAKEDSNGILELTDANFQEALLSRKWVLVEFYAPWCGHCKALAPEYAKAASLLKERAAAAAAATSRPQVVFAKMDATKEPKTAAAYQIQGYPIIKLFKPAAEEVSSPSLSAGGGDQNLTTATAEVSSGIPGLVVLDYRGARTAAALVNWLERKTGPACTIVTTKDELESLVAAADVVVVGFFDAPPAESAEARLFEAAAAEDETNRYVFGQGTALRAAYPNVEVGTVLLLKSFDDGEVRLDKEELTRENLEHFVWLEGRPILFEFSARTAQAIFGSGIHKHLLFLGRKSDEHHLQHAAMLRAVGRDYRHKIIFVHVDVDVAEHANILEFLGVKAEDTPTYVIHEMEKSAKFFPEKKEITEENVRQHVERYLAGQLKRAAKSQPLPPDWDSRPVKALVAENFEKIAMDPSKDVFVEFYAPWCGHCKSLEPVWDELAERFSHRQDKLVAKLDATQNDVDTVEISGFPTLKLFTKETNKLVDFSGSRTLDALVAFLERGGDDAPEAPTKGSEDDSDDAVVTDGDDDQSLSKDEL